MDGITHDSHKEYRRWLQLNQLLAAGEIKDLHRQIKFPFIVEKQKICVFVADFTYRKRLDNWVSFYDLLPGGQRKEIKQRGIDNWEYVVEDVKSPVTRKNRAYRIKVKLLKALYGFTVNEV